MIDLRLGDCLEVLPTLDAGSVDAVVCDPPYELGFMGRHWDRSGIAYRVELWQQVYRVMKPGAFLLAFGGTRTYHRMTCAIEDAGFEIRDCLQWLYGSGFPKSHNLGDGRGTALKPACEPIVMARKPLSEGTVAANVAAWNTGALNIDACRIGTQDKLGGGGLVTNVSEGWDRPHRHDPARKEEQVARTAQKVAHAETLGRWPANVLLDEDAAAELDRQSGTLTSGTPAGKRNATTGFSSGITPGACDLTGYGDTGGASRFFYVAKASRRERNVGCEGLPEQESVSNTIGFDETQRSRQPRNATHTNHHPCVKPLTLMRYLVRLVTPPGGVVLDPFMGSGSTGVAAIEEGFRFVGVEREADYMAIAQARIEAAAVSLRQLEIAV